MISFGEWLEQNVFIIHIREFYKSQERDHSPGSKGIAFNIDTWNKIVENITYIDSLIKVEYQKFLAE